MICKSERPGPGRRLKSCNLSSVKVEELKYSSVSLRHVQKVLQSEPRTRERHRLTFLQPHTHKQCHIFSHTHKRVRQTVHPVNLQQEQCSSFTQSQRSRFHHNARAARGSTRGREGGPLVAGATHTVHKNIQSAAAILKQVVASHPIRITVFPPPRESPINTWCSQKSGCSCFRSRACHSGRRLVGLPLIRRSDLSPEGRREALRGWAFPIQSAGDENSSLSSRRSSSCQLA